MTDERREQIPARTTAQENQTFGLGDIDLTFEQAWRVAKGICDAGMAPKSIGNNPAGVLVIMQAARQLDIPTHWALSNVTFTNGRLGIMGDLAKALVRRAGVLEPGTDFDVAYEGEPFTPGWTCTVSVQRRGIKKRVSRSFSIADAERAGLCRLVPAKEGEPGRIQTHSKSGGWGFHGSPWSGYPQRMLYYRALGFLLRDEFSDVLLGLVVQEELDDYRFAQARDVTPAQGHATEAAPLGLGPGVGDQPSLADLLGVGGTREPDEVIPASKETPHHHPSSDQPATEDGSRAHPEEEGPDGGQGSLL